MNYLTLGLRLRYSRERFDKILGKLNVLYYSLAAWNFLLPFARQACIVKNNFYAALVIGIFMVLGWIFTAIVIFYTLFLVKKCSAQTIVSMNVKMAYKQALSFFLFAVVGVLIIITQTDYKIIQVQDSNYSQALILTLCVEMLASIVLNFISGLFLIYVFYKIYIVVKAEAERSALSIHNNSVVSTVTNTDSNN